MSPLFLRYWRIIESCFDRDSTLDEVLVSGTHPIQLISRQCTSESHQVFDTDDDAIDWVFDLAATSSVRLDIQHPITGGVILNGRYRWHAAIPPVTESSPVVCIRRARLFEVGLRDFADPSFLIEALLKLLSNHRGLLLCGPTGSGKTTLMCALASQLYASRRVVVIEQVPEIINTPSNWLRLRARTASPHQPSDWSVGRVYAESLRMRPDGFLIGEIRQAEEAEVFRSALQSGHDFAWATIHASNESQLKDRLTHLLRGGMDQSGIAYCLVSRGITPSIQAIGNL